MAEYAAINHHFGFVAVWSPKCASHSIGHWLRDALTANGTRVVEGDPSLDVRARGLLPSVAAIAQHPDLLTVAFLRDPLRRVISFHVQFVALGPGTWRFADDARQVSLEGASLRQTVEAIATVADAGERLQHHLTPQVANIPPGTRFDEVVVVERFDQDIERLNRRIGNTAAGPWHYNAFGYGTVDPVADRAEVVPVPDRPPEWFRRHGVPGPAAFLDEDIAAKLARVYAADVAWYASQPGTRLLEPETEEVPGL